jgi:hypothetical protein
MMATLSLGWVLMTAAHNLRFDSLPILALRLRVRFERAAPSPDHAGELWFGAIKRGLESHYPDVLLALCEPEKTLHATSGQRAATNRVTPGFVLRAKACPQAAPGTGADQYVYLTLFGRASAYALPVFYGLLRSAQLGVGRRQLHFRFEQLACFSPRRGWMDAALPTDASGFEAWRWTYEPRDDQPDTPSDRTCLGLRLISRLLLKVNKHLVTRAPDLPALVASLSDRADALGEVWGSGPVVGPALKETLQLAANAAARIDGSGEFLEARRRPSSRQQAVYPSDGLRGTFLYEMPTDVSAQIRPILGFGQWLHLGQQTTAGLGQYELLVHAMY